MREDLVEIRYPRFVMQFGRRIAMGQLFKGDKMVLEGSIAQILQVAIAEDLTINNAQDILTLIVLTNGFAA